MKFSVIILTYNSDLDKVLLTIKSVVNQNFSDYEIIVTDDGSAVDHFEEIAKYFIKVGFENYLFNKNEKNLGNVGNSIIALEKANGKYIKELGVGDLLYDRNTLRKIYDYAELHKTKFAFGKMQSYYTLRNGTVVKHNYSAPRNINEYRKKDKNKKKLLRNVLLYRDWLSSAATFMDREYIKRLRICLSNEAHDKYCDDLAVALILLHNEDIDFFNEYVIWYEYGNGISTNSKTDSKNRLRIDHINFFKYIKHNYGDNLLVKKAYRKNKELIPYYNSINNLIMRKIMTTLNEPYLAFYKLDSLLTNKFKLNKQQPEGFLDDMIFLQKD